MKIDATRYNLFWSNPEKYRLREIWKLAPKEPRPGTFASLLTYGRRRGSCLHELRDAWYRQVPESQAVQDLRDGGFGEKEITEAQLMMAGILEKYPDEETLSHEVLFDTPIPDSPHSLVGRVDHIIRRDGETFVGDWKTSKHRTKSDFAYKGAEYCRSHQVSFYLLGARQLGFTPAGFIYRLVSCRPNRSGVEIQEFPTNRTGLQLKAFARQVHMTCELILWMKATFGIEQSWPQLPSRFDSDYASIAGTNMYEDYMPDGYEPKTEHLELMREVADGRAS